MRTLFTAWISSPSFNLGRVLYLGSQSIEITPTSLFLC